MTIKLFWSDPYLRTCDTLVASVSEAAVTLRETVFFAFSGGQESDAGSIDRYPVIEARKSGLEIQYLLPADHGLHPGDAVRVEIDWNRRYRLMRLHFAAELVLELAYRSLPGIEKLGAHIAADKARIDFAWLENIAPALPGLAAEAQALIDRDLEIISAFSDEAAERRTWEIPGFARVPCGGTHLRRTGEVGRLTLKRDNIGKDRERIEVRAAVDEKHPGPSHP
jgi:Ser-tRNA(Ala) deacylase AlaX